MFKGIINFVKKTNDQDNWLDHVWIGLGAAKEKINFASWIRMDQYTYTGEEIKHYTKLILINISQKIW